MPLVIGRSTNPRCFKSGHMTSLRVTYESNNKAWMTGELFAAWMRRVDNRMRRQNQHILVFLANCGAHRQVELENVKVVFLPPNMTSKLQPMDDGIIQNLKMVYRKKLLRHIIFLVDADTSDIAKKVTVLDAVLWLTSAWDSVKSETISKCFQKCGFSDALLDAATTDDDEWDDADLLPLLPPDITFKDSVDSADARPLSMLLLFTNK